jgi:hypothetical protein
MACSFLNSDVGQVRMLLPEISKINYLTFREIFESRGRSNLKVAAHPENSKAVHVAAMEKLDSLKSKGGKPSKQPS